MDNVGVQEFYKGQTVLLTGATGFLGKAIIDKLLRTCPDVNKLYLLIRPKKGKDSQKRIQDLFDDPVSIIIYYIYFFIFCFSYR